MELGRSLPNEDKFYLYKITLDENKTGFIKLKMLDICVLPLVKRLLCLERLVLHFALFL